MSMSTAPAATADPRSPRRVRHEGVRRRTLTVKQAEKLAPHMVRVTVSGDLAGFTSLGFDDHVKLFFPDGAQNADGAPNLIGRDFTPRRYDAAANTLEIDFAIHEAGPATRWAANVKPGDPLVLGGPRGSFVIPADFDWHLLMGDETALPAIGRRLDELPAGARTVVIAEVDTPAEEIALPTHTEADVIWAHRHGAAPGTGEALSRALKSANLPRGDFYAWVACESLAAKALRRQLIADHGANPKWLRAAGYWRHGAVGIHDVHED